MTSIGWYAIAAIGEIAGCFAFWAWLREGRDGWWIVPGIVCLIIFALALTRIDTDHAGRAYAAYGGIYIMASIMWLWVIEQQTPDRWDVTGTAVALAGAAIILWGPRAA